jgi:hypothetical protein
MGQNKGDLTALWQVVREDDNGNIFLIEGNLSEDIAKSRAKKLDDANRAKPHPHKQAYFAEPKTPRLLQ